MQLLCCVLSVPWPLLCSHPLLLACLTGVCRGLLLFGPPGTGKTAIVRALASECAALAGSSNGGGSSSSKPIALFARKGADCLGKYAGDAELHLRLLFEMVRARGGCFISGSVPLCLPVPHMPCCGRPLPCCTACPDACCCCCCAPHWPDWPAGRRSDCRQLLLHRPSSFWMSWTAWCLHAASGESKVRMCMRGILHDRHLS